MVHIVFAYSFALLGFAFILYKLHDCGIKDWQDFIDSLSTSGGNIVTLFFCSVCAGVLWAWCEIHLHDADVNMGTFGVFTGFTGALLQAQKGNSSRQQMVDRTAPIAGAGGAPMLPTPTTPEPPANSQPSPVNLTNAVPVAAAPAKHPAAP